MAAKLCQPHMFGTIRRTIDKHPMRLTAVILTPLVDQRAIRRKHQHGVGTLGVHIHPILVIHHNAAMRPAEADLSGEFHPVVHPPIPLVTRAQDHVTRRLSGHHAHVNKNGDETRNGNERTQHGRGIIAAFLQASDRASCISARRRSRFR